MVMGDNQYSRLKKKKFYFGHCYSYVFFKLCMIITLLGVYISIVDLLTLTAVSEI